MLAHTEIRSLKGQTAAPITEIIHLLRTSYASKVSDFFIYHSQAYQTYLASLCSLDSKYWAYTLIESNSGKVIGLAMLRSTEKKLFLNQIILQREFQGQGLGGTFLQDVLTAICTEAGAEAFSHLELETFYSNVRARGIYEHMGMQQRKWSYWYHANHSMLVSSFHPAPGGIVVRNDTNGFSQLYFHQVHVGTLIDYEHARINTSDIAVAIQLSAYLHQHHHIGRVCIVSQKRMPLLLLDRSIPYTILMNKILQSFKS